jgi:hypothetical protein
MALGAFRRFQADDYLMMTILCFYTVVIVTINIVEHTSSNLLPPGYDIAHMTKQDIAERTLGSKLILVVENCQIITIWGAKTCLLIMYLRLTTLRRENIAIKVLFGYVVLTFVVMEILYLGVWCRPFHNYWVSVATSHVLLTKLTPNPGSAYAVGSMRCSNESPNHQRRLQPEFRCRHARRRTTDVLTPDNSPLEKDPSHRDFQPRNLRHRRGYSE